METSSVNPQVAVPANGIVQPVSAVPVPFSSVPMKYPTQTVSPSSMASKALNAGFLGFVVVSTGVMGANLTKVTKGEMGVGQAVGDSVIKGASGAVAAASAAAATDTLTSGGLAGLAVTLATATGVSYLMNRVKS